VSRLSATASLVAAVRINSDRNTLDAKASSNFTEFEAVSQLGRGQAAPSGHTQGAPTSRPEARGAIPGGWL
jgi:hypothetical protein